MCVCGWERQEKDRQEKHIRAHIFVAYFKIHCIYIYIFKNTFPLFTNKKKVWAQGSDYESCAQAAALLSNDDPLLQPCLAGSPTWSVRLKTFGTRGRQRSMKGLSNKINRFRDLLLRLPGDVNLNNPEIPLVIFEDGDVMNGEPLQQVNTK